MLNFFIILVDTGLIGIQINLDQILYEVEFFLICESGKLGQVKAFKDLIRKYLKSWVLFSLFSHKAGKAQGHRFSIS